jgi:hypothetical protein
MCCSYLWPRPPAYQNLGFLPWFYGSASTSEADVGHCRCCWRGRYCPCVLLLDANNGDEVIQLSPTLLFCYVWFVLMVVVTFGLGYTYLRWSWVSLFLLYVLCCNMAIAVAILCFAFVQFGVYFFSFYVMYSCWCKKRILRFVILHHFKFVGCNGISDILLVG